MAGPRSTLEDVRPASAGPVRQWPHRLGVALLVVVVGLGAAGFLGVRSRTTSTAGGGYSMTVTYPQVARAGLDVPVRITVRHSGGFTGDVVLAITGDYFRMFETQGFFPDADSVSSDGTFVYFTYAQPPGDNLTIDYDAYIQPSAQIGKKATIRLIISGVEVARASIHTWLVP